MMNTAGSILIAFSICLVFMGCYEYKDFDVYPPDNVYAKGEIMAYQNNITGAIIPLRIGQPDCVEYGTSERRESSHLYHRHHLHRCTQTIEVHPLMNHVLDHSIIATAKSDAAPNQSSYSVKVSFVNSMFELPDPLVNDSTLTTLINSVYDTTLVEVYALAPEELYTLQFVDSIFYSHEFGILRIKTSDGQLWDKIKP